jgi:hypothetical protein
MLCPRCGNEWDVSKSPCSRCGLQVRLPHQMGRTNRAQTSPASQPGTVPPAPQQPGGMSQMNRTVTTPSGSGINTPREGFNSSFPPLPAPDQSDAPGLSFNFGQDSAPGFSRSSGTSFPPLGREKQASIDGPVKFDPQTSPGRTPSIPLSERSSARNIPSRPQTPLPASPVTPFPGTEVGRVTTPFRPSRLVTEKDGSVIRSSQTKNVSADPPTLPGISDPPILPGVSGPLRDQRALMPGTLLRNGRYRLRELQGRQDWLSGVYESMWVAQDAQRAGSQVMICELVVPESSTMMVQSMLRTATMALTSVGRHPRIPTLWDAFSDQGQNFFVFEPIEGESLLARIRRTGRPLPEQDVVAFCLQIVELLDLLSQQSPPLVHGLIRPEHVIINLSGTQYLLTNFSVILAGGATQFVSGVDRSQLSPFMAPELLRGVIDGRLDLYSLLATAYYTVTGSIPNVNSSGVIPSAQSLNPGVSAAFDAILTRGLRPIANQRYQHPLELRQDLLGIRAVSGTLTPKNETLSSGQVAKRSGQGQTSISVSSQSFPDTVAQMLPGMLATGLDDESERGLMLPRPEELPPLEQRNDSLHSILWLVGILVCLIVIVALSRGLT